MRYISEMERRDKQIRKIKNWITLFSFGLIFVGLQGFYYLPVMETLFLLWTGNLCILWVSYIDEDKRLFILTLLMMIAQLSRVA